MNSDMRAIPSTTPLPPPQARRKAGGALRAVLAAVLAVTILLLIPVGAAAQSATAIADEIEASGYYVEESVDSSLAGAIERANSAGAAFVWLDQPGDGNDAAAIATDVWNELNRRGSRYGIVVVLLDGGYWVQASTDVNSSSLAEAEEAALDGFASGIADQDTSEIARGLDDFTSTLTAGAATGSQSTPTTQAPSSSGEDSGGGIGLGSILLPLILLGGGFLLFRSWSGKRKADRATKADMEADRAEIKEQLRDNADRVIDLGDRVVLSQDRELIDAYEQASTTYQDVSAGVDGARTPEEVDELDDRIDHAEWQFEMIEAKLEGRPVPPSPAEVEAEEARKAAEAAAAKKAENDRPALGRDESVTGGGSRAPRASYPRSSYPSGYGSGYGRRGGFGGGLGGMLGSIILGQMGRRTQSRRTQRRSGSWGGAPTRSSGGSLGGGVLRRGGSSGSRGGGGSFGSRSKGSGRSF